MLRLPPRSVGLRALGRLRRHFGKLRRQLFQQFRRFPDLARRDEGLSLPLILNESSTELPGLEARLDRLSHHHGGLSLPVDKPHAFVYHITIKNRSPHTVTLLGRKWVIRHQDGSLLVVEGDGIVGETPRIAPGEEFSYNSYHATGQDAMAHGAFHGVDEEGRKVHVLLPPFHLHIPHAAAS